jgi:hypothetical protein
VTSPAARIKADPHANAYVTKPVDACQFIAAVRHIDEFFVSVVRLPRQ